MDTLKKESAEVQEISWAEFLMSKPPNQRLKITDYYTKSRGPPVEKLVAVPDLTLHCNSEKCGGERTFYSMNPSQKLSVRSSYFLLYQCRNCRQTAKHYAVQIFVDPETDIATAVKFGEIPQFGPHTPPRLISMLGPDRDLFLKGRTSENQGLGIAAFAYYRRVVENQKDRIIDTIINVAEKLGGAETMIAELKKAKGETQFTKAIESIKQGIPEVLKINGHNPLTLLHSALSEGLHVQSDEDCLGFAQSIRIVLAELSERIGIALKDQAELNAAVSRLLTVRSPSEKKVENAS